MAKRKKRNERAREDAAADTTDAQTEADSDSAAEPSEPADAPVDWDSIGREEEIAAAKATQARDDDDDDDDAGDGDGDEPTDDPPPYPPAAPRSMRSRRIVGAIMSVIVPGTGHLAIDRSVRGLLWFVAAMLVMLLFGVSLQWFVLGIIVTFLGSALDVGFSKPGPRQREWILICLLWFAGWMVFGQIRGRIERGWATAYTEQTAKMTPNVLFREWVVVNRRDKIAAGQAVAYEPPCTPSKRTAGRIIAVAGETVEVRCGRAYVNGEPIARTPDGGTCVYKHPVIEEKRFDKRSCEMFKETINGHTFRVLEQPAKFATASAREFPAAASSGKFAEPTCPGETKRDAKTAELARGTITLQSKPGAVPNCDLRAHFEVPKGHVFVLNDNRADGDDSRTWGPVPVDQVVGRINQVLWSEKERGVNFGRLGADVR